MIIVFLIIGAILINIVLSLAFGFGSIKAVLAGAMVAITIIVGAVVLFMIFAALRFLGLVEAPRNTPGDRK